jgi:hypothetical protein
MERPCTPKQSDAKRRVAKVTRGIGLSIPLMSRIRSVVNWRMGITS